MLSANELERLVLNVVLKDVVNRSADALVAEIGEAVTRKRNKLLRAITVAEEQLRNGRHGSSWPLKR